MIDAIRNGPLRVYQGFEIRVKGLDRIFGQPWVISIILLFFSTP